MIYAFDFNKFNQDTLESFNDKKEPVSIDTPINYDYINPFDDFNQSQSHTILFKTVEEGDRLNHDYVKLPSYNKVIWSQICSSLTHLKNELKHLDGPSFGNRLSDTVKQYNQSVTNFGIFEDLFQEPHYKFDKSQLLNFVIPKMIDIALKLPDCIQKPIPILKSRKSHSISLNQEQACCILSNAFFCTFPEWSNESMPLFNFDKLFTKSNDKTDSLKLEKLKCILHYFERVLEKIETKTISVITYARIYTEDVDSSKFLTSKRKIRVPIISNCSRIEECKGALQLDFTSKLIGSGVLETGCLQEEIRFLICPELIVSMLFTECLDDDECLIIRGVERYSEYTGFDDTFKWTGDYIDQTDKDKFNRIMTDILAIDPMFFENPLDQYREDNLWREVKKCYIGFCLRDQFNPNSVPRIATGNWGCGSHNGNKELKFLIQLIVASEVGRDLVYYTFENQEICRNFIRMIEIVRENSLEVGHVYQILKEYCNKIQKLLHKNELPSSPSDQIKCFFRHVFNFKKNDGLVDYLEHHSKRN